MKLKKQLWNQRYLDSNTGWDVGYITTPIKEYIDQIKNKEVKILIPGSGNGYEAEYLFELGFKNIFVLDYANRALKNFKSRVDSFPKSNIRCSQYIWNLAIFQTVLLLVLNFIFCIKCQVS